MKESNQRLQSTVQSAGASHEQRSETKQQVNTDQPLGSFVPFRRMSKVQVEAVRMQGCADGAGAGP